MVTQNRKSARENLKTSLLLWKTARAGGFPFRILFNLAEQVIARLPQQAQGDHTGPQPGELQCGPRDFQQTSTEEDEHICDCLATSWQGKYFAAIATCR
jgi:hypothetical protein